MKDWMKFKGVSVASNRWTEGTGFVPYNQGRTVVLTHTWDQEGHTHIKPETLCRFVTHIPEVGDLYEGDKVRREYICDDRNDDESDVTEFVIVFSDLDFAWAAKVTNRNFEFSQSLSRIVDQTKEGLYQFSVTGNIHDLS
jgi:hypothetical protein